MFEVFAQVGFRNIESASMFQNKLIQVKMEKLFS